jgi:hypothetical protein
MYRYLFSTAVAILMFISVTRFQDSTHNACAPSDIPARTSDLISLFISFGFNLIPIAFSIGCKFILN